MTSVLLIVISLFVTGPGIAGHLPAATGLAASASRFLGGLVLGVHSMVPISFEDDCRARADQTADFASTLRTLPNWIIAHLLEELEPTARSLTFVFIDRHFVFSLVSMDQSHPFQLLFQQPRCMAPLEQSFSLW